MRRRKRKPQATFFVNARVFVAPIDQPEAAGGQCFPVYLVTEKDELGPTWLRPGNSEDLYILLMAPVPGVYPVRCCEIELTLGNQHRRLRTEAQERQVLFYRYYASGEPGQP